MNGPTLRGRERRNEEEEVQIKEGAGEEMERGRVAGTEIWIRIV